MAFDLSFAAFTGRRGETFVVSREGMGPVEVELVEVEDLRDPRKGLPSHVRQDPFQLILRGPVEPLLTQGLYTLAASKAEDVQLFLVPVGPEDGSNWYSVVVN